MPNISPRKLKIIVVCNDERNDAWMTLLIKRVCYLYMLKAGRCRKFLPEDPDGLSIPRGQLPKEVDAILFHSSDMKLWHDIQVEAAYTFEFNTPGTPQPKMGVIPIYRQTNPYFAVRSSDIDELIDFISGQQQVLPSMCQPLPEIDVLPALAILSQSYLEIANKGIATTAVTQPKWWLDSLGLLKQNKLEKFTYQEALKRLEIEWKNLEKPNASRRSLDQLIDSLVVKQFDYYEIANQFALYHSLINDTYQELCFALELEATFGEIEGFVSYDQAYSPKAILAIRGSFLGTAASTSVSMSLSVERQILEPEAVDKINELPREAILILVEAQVSSLPALRRQGFAGPVLVLSTNSFSILKQKYRVLRFGQGSHDALTIPFNLENLCAKVKALVPMEQENLKFFQNEMKACDFFYEQEIIPCLSKLQTFTNLDLATEELATLIEQTRTKTPVACHTVVPIKDKTLEIQQHLHDALINLKEKNDLESTILYLQAVFEHWHKLVQSAAGENLKLAS